MEEIQNYETRYRLSEEHHQRPKEWNKRIILIHGGGVKGIHNPQNGTRLWQEPLNPTKIATNRSNK